MCITATQQCAWYQFPSLFVIGDGREMDTRYPSAETVFEYFVDVKNRQWLNWDSKLSGSFKPRLDVPSYRLLVPTVDTVRNTYVAGALVRNTCHTLVVGAVGVGKTMTIQGMLDAMPADRSHCIINFSAQTSSASLQVCSRQPAVTHLMPTAW